MNTLSGLSPAAAAATLPGQTIPALGKGKKAAREFEAQLIGTVLQSLEKTLASVPGQDPIPGEDDYNYLGTQALASAVAAGGGFGIARMISEHLIAGHMLGEHAGGTKVAAEGGVPGSASGH
jgi:Rod binding domain-containing protein